MTLIQRMLCHTCTDPDRSSLEIASALYDLYTGDEFANFSLNIIPCRSSENVITSSTIVTSQCEHNQAPEGSCSVPQNGGAVVTESGNYNGATCFWNYVIDFDNDRIPKQLAKAVCACSHCHRGSCRPVNSYIPVLRKECDIVSGMYVYRKYLQELPVGCACIRARRVSQGSVFRHRSIKIFE